MKHLMTFTKPGLCLTLAISLFSVSLSGADEYKFKPNPICKNSTAYNPATFTKNKAQAELFKAVVQNRPEMVMLFAAKGANVDMKAAGGDSLLHVAVTCGGQEALRALLEVGLAPDSPDGEGLPAMWRAVQTGNIQALPVLRKYGAGLTARSGRLDNGTLLHEAARRGNDKAIGWLLGAGGLGPDLSDENGRTPLHLAAERGHLSSVKLLVDHGATVDLNDRLGRSPLLRPAKEGHDQVVRYLLERGANVKIRDDYGITPLHLAARNGHINTVRLLIARGADLNAADSDNETPLYWTAGSGHLNTLRELLEAGADLSVRNKDRLTALHWAAASDRAGAVEALVARGAEVDDRAAHGLTPLHLAAAFGHPRTVRALLQAGAQVEARDERGRTPAAIAASKGHQDVVSLIESYAARQAASPPPQATSPVGSSPLLPFKT